MNYKYLIEGDFIQTGDEYFCCDDCGWTIANQWLVSQKVTKNQINIFRRPIQERKSHPQTDLFK